MDRERRKPLKTVKMIADQGRCPLAEKLGVSLRQSARKRIKLETAHWQNYMIESLARLQPRARLEMPCAYA